MIRQSTNLDNPLVSVILATRDRPTLFPVALACYSHQTYANRELIVVDDGEQFPVEAASIESLGGRLIRVPPGTPLGAKLNRGIEAASGLLCQKMDDDDWYAPDFMSSMCAEVLKHRTADVFTPAFAFLKTFLFFELSRWEIRQSYTGNIPGATFLFHREDWAYRPFRNLRFDEDSWFYWDAERAGVTMVPAKCLESFLAVRHGNGSRDRGHTWVRQWDGQTLESYLQNRPLYHRKPEEILPEWVIPIYRSLS